MKVLLVEDLLEVAEATREILEGFGHEVKTVSTGAEALAILEPPKHGFDALITDLRLPGISGTEVLVHLLGRGTSLALVAYSASRGDPILRALVLEGRVLFLRKPFSAEDLAGRLAAALEARNLPVSPPGIPESQVAKPQPPIKRSYRRWLAVAVFAIVLAGGLKSWISRAPDLPPAPSSSVSRGAILDGTVPRGTLQEFPKEFRWQEVPKANAYRVEIRGVDGTRLWQGTCPSPMLLLEDEHLSLLHRTVVYSWTVVAVGSDGRTLASSQKTRFLIKPTSPPPPLAELGSHRGQFP